MESTIVRIEFGSHLYGTNTPTSDHDYKSVYIPSAHDILLQRVKGSTGHKVKRYEREKNAPEDTDDEAYSLQRYMTLLAEGQTVTIDMLFAPKPLISSSLWKEIRANKDRFLTKHSASFVGYCRTQANKYGIKGSRVAAAKQAMELFKSEYARLGPTAKVHEIADLLPTLEGEHTHLLELPLGPTEATGWFIEVCNRKIAYGNTLKQASEVFAKIYENYGHRARLAETNEGVDWKALSHAVRVANEAIELLTTANVTFPLPNAAHVLSIKRGEVPYEQVAEEIEGLLLDVEKASEESMLREDADTEFIDDLVKRVYRESVIAGD